MNTTASKNSFHNEIIHVCTLTHYYNLKQTHQYILYDMTASQADQAYQSGSSGVHVVEVSPDSLSTATRIEEAALKPLR